MKLIQCKKCSEVFEEEEIVIHWFGFTISLILAPVRYKKAIFANLLRSLYNKKKDYYCRICFYEDYEKSLNKK